MAEKRGKRTKNELLSVVVNFESLRFMALVKENYLISDLIAETEETFTKLYSTKVTIKTLKNSVNAVLPDWYPVAPLIKNGDEIFAFRATAADVMNNNFLRPTNRHFAQNTGTSTNPKCSVYNSSFSSGITPGKNSTDKTDQQETQETRMDSATKTTGSGFKESVDLGGVMSDQESERLSETFSFQPVKHSRSVNDSTQGIGTEKVENEVGQKSEDVESKMSNDKSVSVQKSKTNDISNSDSTEDRASNLRKCTNDSGVSVGGRSSIIGHSKAPESKSARKVQKQSTRTKNTATEVDGEFEKSHSGKNSDNDSWTSSGSSGGKERKERTPVQNGSPVDSAKQKKGDSKSDKSDSTKQMPKKSSSKDESEESSDDDKGNVETTSVKATREGGRKNSEQKSGEVSEHETSSIHSDSSESTPPAKVLKKPQVVKRPKIISIKFTKPEKASPACTIKTEVVVSSDSDGESSWTESIEMNTPKKTPLAEDGDNKGNRKLSQVKGNDSKDKTMEASDDSDNESNDSSQATDTGNEKLFAQAPASDHAAEAKNVDDTIVHKSNSSDKNGKANTSDTDADSDSGDSDGAKTMGGKPKVSTSNGSNKKAKANTSDASDDSDSGDSDSSSEKPLTQLPAKTGGGKPKHTINNPVTTSNGSKANTSALEKSLKKFAAITSGKSNDPVDHPAAGTSIGSNKKLTAKTPEADNDSDNESSDSSSEEPFQQPPATTSSKSKGAANNPTRSSKSSDKKPTARTMVGTELDLDSDTKHPSKTIDDSDSTACLDTKNAAETTNAKSKSDAKQSVSLKKTGFETPKNKKQLEKDSKTSPRFPRSPITPHSRKAALDKSKSKVASWLLANDVPDGAGECDNTSTSDQGGIMTRAQKSKKRAKKRARGRKKESNEEQESEKTAEPKLPKSQDTIFLDLLSAANGGPTLGSPKKAAEKSQKRKQNETAEVKREEQPLNKNAKRRRRQKKAPNDKNKANEDDDDQEKDTNESDKNGASSTAQAPPVISGKRKTTTLTLPKKSKGLSALLEDDVDFDNFQTPKKPKRTAVWSDRVKPTGFLTPSNSMERKSGWTGSGKQRIRKLPSSQPKQAVELNVEENELLSSGALNLETLFNDESVTW